MPDDDKPLGVRVRGVYCSDKHAPTAMKENDALEVSTGDTHVAWFECPKCGAHVQVGYAVVR
jgi:hypothetical protein